VTIDPSIGGLPTAGTHWKYPEFVTAGISGIVHGEFWG
jgi:hypothetical protein